MRARLILQLVYPALKLGALNPFDFDGDGQDSVWVAVVWLAFAMSRSRVSKEDIPAAITIRVSQITTSIVA